MRPLLAPLANAARFAFALALAAALGGCSMFRSESPAASEKKKGWSLGSLWPFGGAKSEDATAHIEYQRTRSSGADPLYTLWARNTHLTKTIEGQMRTTMQTSPSDVKMDSQSFTLAPNEQKKLLIYPARFHLTYEVTAHFQD